MKQMSFFAQGWEKNGPKTTDVKRQEEQNLNPWAEIYGQGWVPGFNHREERKRETEFFYYQQTLQRPCTFLERKDLKLSFLKSNFQEEKKDGVD